MLYDIQFAVIITTSTVDYYIYMLYLPLIRFIIGKPLQLLSA